MCCPVEWYPWEPLGTYRAVRPDLSVLRSTLKRTQGRQWPCPCPWRGTTAVYCESGGDYCETLHFFTLFCCD